MKLEEAVAKAIERLQTPGIEAWGLHVHEQVLDLVGGEVIPTGPAKGCVSETCRHVSHDPAAPMRRWIPPADVCLVRLAEDWANDEGVVYYVARTPQGDVFLQLRDPLHYWAELYVTEQVPAWVLQEALHRVVEPAGGPKEWVRQLGEPQPQEVER